MVLLIQENMREATRTAMRLFGWLLAEDMGKVDPDAEWLPVGRAVLTALDSLDVVGDEEADRNLEVLVRAPGLVWLQLAEDGFFEGTDYVAHVLAHFEEGGYTGPPWVRAVLQAIDAADEDNRDALAAGLPEYVGLMRACLNVEGGRQRLVAVLDRR